MFRQILELQKQSMEAERQSRAEFFTQLAQFFGTLTNVLIQGQPPRPDNTGGPLPAPPGTTNQHLSDTQAFAAFTTAHAATAAAAADRQMSST